MNNKPFIINNQILVNPELGLIEQKDSGHETRVEPKLMHLLCVLVMHNHELVLRGLLARHVFSNMGKEGTVELTKGILLLRKALGDESNALIETVEGKGYILHASVDFGSGVVMPEMEIAANKPGVYWIIGFVVIALMITGYFIYRTLHP